MENNERNTSKDYTVTFGDVMDDLLNKKGMSRKELSEKTGISQNKLSAYAKERMTVPEQNARLIAQALNEDISLFPNVRKDRLAGNVSEDAPYADFANNLRALMRENNVTLRQLGAALNMNPSAFYTYVDGISMPRPALIASIAGFLKTDPKTLIGKSKRRSGRKLASTIDPQDKAQAQEFAQKLKICMAKAGIKNAYELSKLSGISTYSLGRYIKGAKVPIGSHITILSSIFDVDPKYFGPCKDEILRSGLCLKERADECKISTQEISASTGISKDIIQKYMSGEELIPNKDFKKIAWVISMDLCEPGSVHSSAKYNEFAINIRIHMGRLGMFSVNELVKASGLNQPCIQAYTNGESLPRRNKSLQKLAAALETSPDKLIEIKEGTFISNIAAAMRIKGITHHDLRAMTGLDQGYISKLLNDKARISIKDAVSISSALNIPLSKLLGPIDGRDMDDITLPITPQMTGKMLREQMKKARITEITLAKRTGIQRETLIFMMNGEMPLRLHHALEIARALGCTTGSLYGAHAEKINENDGIQEPCKIGEWDSGFIIAKISENMASRQINSQKLSSLSGIPLQDLDLMLEGKKEISMIDALRLRMALDISFRDFMSWANNEVKEELEGHKQELLQIIKRNALQIIYTQVMERKLRSLLKAKVKHFSCLPYTDTLVSIADLLNVPLGNLMQEECPFIPADDDYFNINSHTRKFEWEERGKILHERLKKKYKEVKRQDRNIMQKLSEAAGVCDAAVRVYMRQDTTPRDPQAVDKMAAILGTSPEYLTGKSDDDAIAEERP